jgi:tetratricopeptide (TPR) repeat protein
MLMVALQTWYPLPYRHPAVICYELAIHFNPFCCEAFNNLGVIYKDRDNLEKAIECYRSALGINPTFSQTLNNLGVVYTVQGKVHARNARNTHHRTRQSVASFNYFFFLFVTEN